MTLFWSLWPWALKGREDPAPVIRPAEMVKEIVVPRHRLMMVNQEELFPPHVRDSRPPRIGVFGERPAAM